MASSAQGAFTAQQYFSLYDNIEGILAISTVIRQGLLEDLIDDDQRKRIREGLNAALYCLSTEVYKTLSTIEV